MSTEVTSTAEVVAEFFRRFGAGDNAATAALFAPEVDFCVAGAEFVPWTGERSTRAEVEQFLASAVSEVETEQFAVDRVIADGQSAVALGQFAHRVKRTGKLFQSRFALHVEVVDGAIRLYRLFEDSYAVADAFRD